MFLVIFKRFFDAVNRDRLRSVPSPYTKEDDMTERNALLCCVQHAIDRANEAWKYRDDQASKAIAFECLLLDLAGERAEDRLFACDIFFSVYKRKLEDQKLVDLAERIEVIGC